MSNVRTINPTTGTVVLKEELDPKVIESKNARDSVIKNKTGARYPGGLQRIKPTVVTAAALSNNPERVRRYIRF
jgi:hypothetical protein